MTLTKDDDDFDIPFITLYLNEESLFSFSFICTNYYFKANEIVDYCQREMYTYLSKCGCLLPIS